MFQADQSYANQGIVTFDDNSVHDESGKHVPCDNDANDVNFTDRQFEGYEVEEPTLNDPIGDFLIYYITYMRYFVYVDIKILWTTFAADTECLTNSQGESLPPPSEWYVLCNYVYKYTLFVTFYVNFVLMSVFFVCLRLEDTLIELYLSGYANQTTDDASGAKPLDDDTSTNMPTDGLSKIFLVLFGEIMLWVDHWLTNC